MGRGRILKGVSMKYFLALILSSFMSFSMVAQAQTQPTVPQLQQVITDLNNELIEVNKELVTCQGAQPVTEGQGGPYTYDVVNGVWLDGFLMPIVSPWYWYGGVRYWHGIGPFHGARGGHFSPGHRVGHSNAGHGTTGHSNGHGTNSNHK